MQVGYRLRLTRHIDEAHTPSPAHPQAVQLCMRSTGPRDTPARNFTFVTGGIRLLSATSGCWRGRARACGGVELLSAGRVQRQARRECCGCAQVFEPYSQTLLRQLKGHAQPVHNRASSRPRRRTCCPGATTPRWDAIPASSRSKPPVLSPRPSLRQREHVMHECACATANQSPASKTETRSSRLRPAPQDEVAGDAVVDTP